MIKWSIRTYRVIVKVVLRGHGIIDVVVIQTAASAASQQVGLKAFHADLTARSAFRGHAPGVLAARAALFREAAGKVHGEKI